MLGRKTAQVFEYRWAKLIACSESGWFRNCAKSIRWFVPKKTIVLKGKKSSDLFDFLLRNLNDFITYDVIISLPIEAEVENFVVKRKLSKMEAEKAVEKLKNYGARMIPRAAS